MADDLAETSDVLVEATPPGPVPPGPAPLEFAPPLLDPEDVKAVAPVAPRRGIAGSWWRLALTATAVSAGLAAAVWFSTRMDPDPLWQRLALFAHLSSLVVGFGAVLAADYFCLLWLVKRSTLGDALASVNKLHLLIWAGLIGLIASGALLEPNLHAPWTRVKLSLVFILTLNGVQALALNRRMLAASAAANRRLIAWGGVTATVSQACWWGAVVIGFLTATARR